MSAIGWATWVTWAIGARLLAAVGLLSLFLFPFFNSFSISISHFYLHLGLLCVCTCIARHVHTLMGSTRGQLGIRVKAKVWQHTRQVIYKG